MGLIVVTPPAANTWPVSIEQVKSFLRITNDYEDDEITAIINDACEFIETETGQQMLTATKLQTYDGFTDNRPVIFNSASVVNVVPSLALPTPSRIMVIDSPPLQAVTSVQYVASGSLATLATNQYTVDTTGRPGQVVLNPSLFWPTADDVPASVQITFTCGYGTPVEVPNRFKRAIKYLCAHYYENRELGVGRNEQELPYGLRSLIESLMFREAYAA